MQFSRYQALLKGVPGRRLSKGGGESYSSVAGRTLAAIGKRD